MNESDAGEDQYYDSLEGVPPPSATPTLHGHEDAWAEFAAAEVGGRMHHAWLLQGPRGIGKATAAFALARRLLAGPDAAATFRQIAQGGHPNLLHLTRPPAERGGGFRTQITVEEIRRLNRFFHSTSPGDRWRIAIVDPADDLNRNAANALLKILEEPPERALFLITNHLPGRLLPTIRSRCRVLRFEPLTEARLADAVEAMPLDRAGSEIRAAAALAGGSVRTALALLISGGLEFETRLDRLWQDEEPDWAELQALADVLTRKGKESALELFVESLFRRLADEAAAALRHGETGRAKHLADLWSRESERLREGFAFNLDRKQMLLTFFLRLFQARTAHAGPQTAPKAESVMD